MHKISSVADTKIKCLKFIFEKVSLSKQKNVYIKMAMQLYSSKFPHNYMGR